MSPIILSLSLAQAALLDVLLALTTHLIYNRLEIPPDRILPTFALLGLMPSVPLVSVSNSPYPQWVLAPFAYALFYTSLLISIAAYRLSPFHPLATYPGPILAKLTKFHMVWTTIRGQQHVYLKSLHDRYGDYIRVGPNELSFAHVDAIDPILGAAGLPKGPLWTARAGTRRPLIAMTDAREHAARRRIWNRAFSSGALRQYEPLLKKRALQLCEDLERRVVLSAGEKDGEKTGVEVDLAQWLSYFSFDFMFDMAFGGGFELMAEGDTLGLWSMVERAIETFALMQNIPWASSLLYKLPSAIGGAVQFIQFAYAQAGLRKKRTSGQRDLFSYLMDEDGHLPIPPSDEQVLSDAGLAIGAGSDTTATVLAGAFHFLLTHPCVLQTLRAELDSLPGRAAVDSLDASALSRLPYLTAVIEETMRLQPAVPTALQRAPAKGSGGYIVGTRFIPEGTSVYVPPYVLHRDARFFSPCPDSFMPERWLQGSSSLSSPTTVRAPSCSMAPITSFTALDTLPSSSLPDTFTKSNSRTIISEYRHTPNAYIPFSYGPANCAGRPLAYLELRAVLALILARFHIALPENESVDDAAERWTKEMRDLMVVKTGELRVVLSLREDLGPSFGGGYR